MKLAGFFLVAALVVIAGAIAPLSRQDGLTAPTSKAVFVALAFAAPVVTASGFVFDLFLGAERQEFPPWADSLGIPLAGVPIMLLVLTAWSCSHFLFLAGVKKKAPVRLSLATLRGGHKWLLFVASATALLILLMAFSGAYWYALPSALWLYYYLSIAALQKSQDGRDLVPE